MRSASLLTALLGVFFLFSSAEAASIARPIDRTLAKRMIDISALGRGKRFMEDRIDDFRNVRQRGADLEDGMDIDEHPALGAPAHPVETDYGVGPGMPAYPRVEPYATSHYAGSNAPMHFYERADPHRLVWRQNGPMQALRQHDGYATDKDHLMDVRTVFAEMQALTGEEAWRDYTSRAFEHPEFHITRINNLLRMVSEHQAQRNAEGPPRVVKAPRLGLARLKSELQDDEYDLKARLLPSVERFHAHFATLLRDRPDALPVETARANLARLEDVLAKGRTAASQARKAIEVIEGLLRNGADPDPLPSQHPAQGTQGW